MDPDDRSTDRSPSKEHLEDVSTVINHCIEAGTDVPPSSISAATFSSSSSAVSIRRSGRGSTTGRRSGATTQFASSHSGIRIIHLHRSHRRRSTLHYINSGTGCLSAAYILARPVLGHMWCRRRLRMAGAAFSSTVLTRWSVCSMVEKWPPSPLSPQDEQDAMRMMGVLYALINSGVVDHLITMALFDRLRKQYFDTVCSR